MGPNWLARIAATRHARALGGGLLALAAVVQATAWAAVSSAASSVVPNAALFSLLALASTVPLIFLRGAACAIAITAANVLAIAAFGTTTVAGIAAQVIAVCELGREGGPRRGGAQLLAACLTLPFLILSLTSHGGVSAVLLTALVPAAAGTGIALRARREADVQTPPVRCSPTRLPSTWHAASARASPASCTTSSHTISP